MKYFDTTWKKVLAMALAVLVLGLVLDLVIFGAEHGVDQPVAEALND